MSLAIKLRVLRDRLKEPFEDEYALVAVLETAKVDTLSASTSDDVRSLHRLLPAVQNNIIELIIPTFLHILKPAQQHAIISLFAPQRLAAGISNRRIIASISYLNLTSLLSSTTLPQTSRPFIINVIQTLVKSYGVHDLYWSVYGTTFAESSRDANLRNMQWEELVKASTSLPARVANAVGRWSAEGVDVPRNLIPRTYFNSLIISFENLLYEISQSQPQPDLFPFRFLIERLASLGLFIDKSNDRAPSFMTPFLPGVLRHLHPPQNSDLPPYPAAFLPDLVNSLQTSTISRFITSLLDAISANLNSGDLNPGLPDERIRRAVLALQDIVGFASVGCEVYEAVVQDLQRDRGSNPRSSREHARTRVVVGWIQGGGRTVVAAFIDSLLSLWTDPKYIKYSLYSRQLHLTHLLLLSLSRLPAFDAHLVDLSHRGSLLLAFQSYLAHPDGKIRRLGMLVAETLSQLSIPPSDNDTTEYEDLEITEDMNMPKPQKTRRLDFGASMWAGDGEGKVEARWLRASLGVNDMEANLSSDDSLWMLGWHPSEPLNDTSSNSIEQVDEGVRPEKRARPANRSQDDTTARPKIQVLDGSPVSSRSPSPTPSFLDEVANDPSLAIGAPGKVKPKRPVYIGQLIKLLQEREHAEALEMGLKHGESLIRAKRSYGLEVSENAAILASIAIGLNDQYELENFENLRQGIVTALVACAPLQTAPILIEEYFNNSYSLQQRSVILTALAMGARELAGLPVPSHKTKSVDFPSKVLPPSLHKKYISSDDTASFGQIEDATNGMRALLISKGARKADDLPEFQREKRLSVKERSKTAPTINSTTTSSLNPYKDVAAEYFIMPLINRFWQALQDSNTRESRALLSETTYRSAGTGILLSSLALERFLMALALLLHAARHSPHFLAVLAPESLELAVTIGARQVYQPIDEAKESTAQVIAAGLEVALVALDGSIDLDGGRTLASDKAELVLACGEWAHGVFEKAQQGERISGEGGSTEGRLEQGSAGVVVRVAEIGEKWKGFR